MFRTVVSVIMLGSLIVELFTGHGGITSQWSTCNLRLNVDVAKRSCFPPVVLPS